MRKIVERSLGTRTAKELLFCQEVNTLLALGIVQCFVQFYVYGHFLHTSQVLERTMDLHTCLVFYT